MPRALIPAIFAVLTAGLALHLCGQAQAGATTHATAPSTRQSAKPDPAAIERGSALFSSHCAFCHGADAHGGESGPDLIRSLVVLDDEHGERIGAVVLNGRPSRGMPKFDFSADQIGDLAAFLHNRIQATAAFNSYQVLNILVGDAKAGETYFDGPGGCSRCHSVTGDLAHVGSRYPPEELQQKFVMPRGEGGTAQGGAAIRAKVTMPSGEIYEGRVTEIDDFHLTLIDSSGARRTFDRNGDTPHVELTDPLAEHIRLLSKYTDGEIHNLTAYLVTLK
jgi:mono/diheme cytochrome c family protein